jgi:hypothetical protein
MSSKNFVRLMCTSLVLVSLVQHDLAFAVETSTKLLPSVRLKQQAEVKARRLKQPEDLASAIALVNQGKALRLDSYFANGGTPDEVANLNSDVITLILANSRMGFIDNRGEFEVWYKAHETSIIMAANKSPETTLQSLVVESYMAFITEGAVEKRDVPGLLLKLEDLIENPATIAAGGLMAVYGTYSFIVNLVKGAAIAGPGAGIFGALVEPIVRPFRERAAVLGNRLLGDRGAKLAERLNSEKESLIETRSQIEARERARDATVKMMARRGLEMTREQAHENMELLKSNWNEAKQIWESTHTGGYRDGRSYTSDNLILRPHALLGPLINSVVGREVFRQGIEANIDRMMRQTNDPAKMQELAFRYMQEIKVEHHAEAEDRKSAAARSRAVKATRAELLALGATDYQLDRIYESQRSELVLYRQAAVTLASAALYDLMYPEFNRELPSETLKAYDLFKSHYCFDYFEAEFRTSSAKILNQIGLDLKAAKKRVNADLAQVEGEIKAIEEKTEPPKAEKREAKKLSFIETRTHRPMIVNRLPLRLVPSKPAAQKPAAKPAPKPAPKAEPTKAADALKGFVSSAENRAAAAGAADLKPGRKKTMAERAREASIRAGKK